MNEPITKSSDSINKKRRQSAKSEKISSEKISDDGTDHSEQEQYRQLADAMPQIVWSARPDGYLNYYNRRWFEYTGMTLEETQGWGWQPVLHPDDVERCVNVWSEAVSSGEPYEIEYRFKRASDGQYRWHLGRALPVRDKDGKIIKWYGTCTDIDDHKKTETELLAAREEMEKRVTLRTHELTNAFAALAQSEERFRSVTQSANDAIIAADSRGLILTWNKGAQNIFGYTETEAVGQPLTIIMPERYRSAHMAGMARHNATGETKVIGRTVELTGLRKDGREFPIELSLGTWKTGQDVFYSSIIRDITQRKYFEDALKESERKLFQLMDAMPVAVFVTDAAGKP
ncbi:MAG: PAS domain S-box protein, partial [Actinomycetota bacterium]